MSSEYKVAVFTADGALEGTGTQRVAALSKKWIDVCRGMLAECGPKFRVPLGPLRHLEVGLTSSDDIGVGMFFANSHIALSTLYLGKQSGPEAAAELMEMFLASLRRAMPVAAQQHERPAFSDLTEIHERPLYAVVVWANPAVSEDDYQLLREFSTHFAAAFFGLTGCERETH